MEVLISVFGSAIFNKELYYFTQKVLHTKSIS